MTWYPALPFHHVADIEAPSGTHVEVWRHESLPLTARVETGKCGQTISFTVGRRIHGSQTELRTTYHDFDDYESAYRAARIFDRAGNRTGQ